jgi:hypothetical protein
MVVLTGRSALFLARCSRCGFEQGGIVDFAIPYSEEPWVDVFVAWRGGRVTAVQVAMLRKLVPEVAARSIREVVYVAGERVTMALGRYRESVAEGLVSRGRALDLDLRYARVAEDAGDAAIG